ncbi:hypothetical protein [Plesiomonas shigelloides]|uniref:Putative O-antigen transporter n=1 Tax=Plesiomonas shigelloides TaxID=703 RepID=A0A4D6U7E9_PLESH|nr:hypothetical protein [Plesiomonas shigelloides]QCH03169.1 putative O antigen flippase [Plesiomonas shigelloides]
MEHIRINIVILIFERTIQLLGALFIASLISRGLDTNEFGNWQLTLSYLAIFSAFSIFCASEVIVPRFVRHQDSSVIGRIVFNVFVARLVTTVLCYLIIVGFVFYIDSSKYNFVFAVLCFSVVINESISSFGAFLTAQKKSYYLSLARVLSFSIKVSLIYSLYFFSNITPFKLAIVWITEASILGCVIFILYKKTINKVIFPVNVKYIRLLLSRSMIFGVGLGFFILFRKLDKLFVSYYFTGFDLGVYAASSQLLEVVYQLIIVMAAVLAPIIIYDEKALKLIVENKYKIIFWYSILSIMACYLVYLSFPFIYDMLFPVSYHEGKKYFLIVMWFFPLFLVDNLVVLYIIQKLSLSFYVKKWVLTCVFFILSFVLLVKSMGVFATPISIILSILFTFLITLFYLRKVK